MPDRTFEVWDTISGNLIYTAESYDDAVQWLHNLWCNAGDDSIKGLSLGSGTTGMSLVVNDDMLLYLLKDMPL
jgi:hypothetical protein